jgi:hypothetical protein
MRETLKIGRKTRAERKQEHTGARSNTRERIGEHVETLSRLIDTVGYE